MTTLTSKADAVLRQFPGPVTLRPSPWKVVAITLICLPLAALAAWAIWSGPPLGILIISILLFACFGLGGIAAVVALFGGAVDLTLTADGMEFRNTWRGPLRRRWDQVAGFAPMHVANAWRVVYEDETVRNSWQGKQRLLPDTYRMGAMNMAALLAAWRERALAACKPEGKSYGSSSVSQ